MRAEKVVTAESRDATAAIWNSKIIRHCWVYFVVPIYADSLPDTILSTLCGSSWVSCDECPYAAEPSIFEDCNEKLTLISCYMYIV